MTCVLLDDELPGLQYLKLICQQTPGLDIVKAYNDPRKFLAECKDLSFDCCILDIHMPEVNGLEVAAAIRDKPVIFITGHKEYAADAFDLEAVDYIRKPIDLERFGQAIRKMEERLGGARFARLNSSQGKILLYFDEVLLIRASETDARDKRAYLEGGRELLLKNISFDQLLALLPRDKFRRVNKQNVVALKAVRFFNHDTITLADPPIELTLSEAYRAGFHYK
jgi:two-component system, LytTR family, response regulator